MRIKYLAFMASWVILGAQADDQDGADGVKAQFEPPGDKLVIGSGKSEVAYTITEADTPSTTLYLLEITRLNGVDVAAKAGKLQGTKFIECTKSPNTMV
jgi:hypothetical protein